MLYDGPETDGSGHSHRQRLVIQAIERCLEAFEEYFWIVEFQVGVNTECPASLNFQLINIADYSYNGKKGVFTFALRKPLGEVNSGKTYAINIGSNPLLNCC